MSILTGFVTAKEGVLAVDTLAAAPFDGGIRYSSISKCHVLPLLGAIFGTRGANTFPNALATCINRLPIADFDTLLAHLREAIGHAYEIAAKMNDDLRLTHATQLLMMGWSRKQGRVVAVTAKNHGDDVDPYGPTQGYSPEFSYRDVPVGAFMIPGVGPIEIERLKERSKRQTPQEFVVSAAKAQRQWIDGTMAPGFIGGRLIITTVNRFGIGVRQVDVWPDDAELYQLMGELEGASPAAVQ